VKIEKIFGANHLLGGNVKTLLKIIVTTKNFKRCTFIVHH
jgi:hypothetical protein